MAERPIIFSSEMVKAILDGRKTQTRRIIKGVASLQFEINEYPSGCRIETDGDFWWASYSHRIGLSCPYGVVGDRLWVRETWATDSVVDDEPPRNLTDDFPVWWKANGDSRTNRHQVCAVAGKWRSPYHMPKWAARIWLEITNIRVERVQEISEEDALADGGWEYKSCPAHKAPILSFHILWDSLNAKRGYSWEKNPWVWVIDFRKA